MSGNAPEEHRPPVDSGGWTGLSGAASPSSDAPRRAVDSAGWTGLDAEASAAASRERAAEQLAAAMAAARARERWERFSSRVPELGRGAKLLFLGIAAALGYTIVALAGGLARDPAWLDFVEPVVRRLASAFPMIDWLPGELAARGFARRAPEIRHVLAVDWLITGVSFLAALFCLWPARGRLAEPWLELRDAPGSSAGLVGGFSVLSALLLPLVATCSNSAVEGRRFSYDLGAGDFGLLVFLLLMLWFWVTLYVLAAFVLGATFSRRRKKELF